jgi:DNA-binding PadR family transcriptional regulator
MFLGRRGWLRASFLGRGDSRLLVLMALRSRAMHGYEVAKEISRMFGGFYEPSPGAVYPTLQCLEDEGLVRSEVVEGRRVYSLTEAGERYLAERGGRVERLLEACSTGSGRPEVLTAGRRLAQTVMLLMAEGDPEKMRQAAEILEEARRKVAELVTR